MSFNADGRDSAVDKACGSMEDDGSPRLNEVSLSQSSSIKIIISERWSRVLRLLPEWLRGKDRAVLVIGVLFSAVSTAVGVADLAWPWLVIAGCACTAVAALATHAIEARKQREKIHSLWAALAVACAVPIVAFCYHEWWDPARSSPASHEAIVNGNGAQVFYPYNEPGGAQGYTYEPLPADGTIRLSCFVSLPRTGLWFLVAGNGGWIPRDAMHAIPGIPFPSLPRCS